MKERINMMRKTWKKYNVFVLYYIIGVLSSLFMVAYPLLFVERGYSTKEIGVLISLGFIASIFQPIIGYISDRFLSKLKTLSLVFILFIISAITMIFSSGYIFIGALIINALMKSSMPALIDSYYNRFPEQFSFPYAKVRTAMPIGLGTAMFALSIFIALFDTSMNGVLIFVSILSIIALCVIFSIEDLEKDDEQIDVQVTNTSTNYQAVFALFMYAFLYAGMNQITSTYLSIHFNQFGYSAQFIGTISLLMLVPQLLLMFNYERWLGNFKRTSIMAIAVAFGVAQASIYVFMSNSIVMLAVASMFGGVQLVLYPASFYPSLAASVKTSRISTAMTLNATIQALLIGLFNVMVVSTVYQNTNTTVSVYVIVIIVELVSLLAIMMYKRVK